MSPSTDQTNRGSIAGNLGFASLGAAIALTTAAVFGAFSSREAKPANENPAPTITPTRTDPELNLANVSLLAPVSLDPVSERQVVTPGKTELDCDSPNATELAAEAFQNATFWLNCPGIDKTSKDIVEMRKAAKPPAAQPDPAEVALQKDLKRRLSFVALANLQESASYFLTAEGRKELGEPVNTCFRPGYEAQENALWYGLIERPDGSKVPGISIGKKGQFENFEVPTNEHGWAYATQKLAELNLNGITSGAEFEPWYQLVKNYEAQQQR